MRAAGRVSDGRRFLVGDAAHLSSALSGEGLNAAFMDAADIAWKLPLVIRGEAKPSLLDSYAAEREIADHHMLEVSHEVHSFVMNLIAECDGGGEPAVPVPDPGRGHGVGASAVNARHFVCGKRAGGQCRVRAGSEILSPPSGRKA